jgi:hypothetical protein
MIRQALGTEQDLTARLDVEGRIAYAYLAMQHYYDKTHARK